MVRLNNKKVMEINEEDFRKLQGDVTLIKNALIGNEYGDGVIKRLHLVECDQKANGEITGEIIRWKSEAQKWKDKAEGQLIAIEQIKWKFAGAVMIISFMFAIFSKYILQKMGL